MNFKKKRISSEEALERIKDKPLSKKLELFSLKNSFEPGEPLLLHDEPIFNKENKIVGYTTSSNFSFCYNKNICLAFINIETDCENLYLEVEGTRHALNFEKEPLHDPTSRLMRN